MDQKSRIYIIGGGLSGLTLAYFLSKKNIASTILEASPEPGGRIQTIKGKLGTPLELGATWFSDVHQNLLSLIAELGLQKYPQFSMGTSLFQTKSFEPPQKFFVPEAENPSYRLVGGTGRLIEALAEKLPKETILLNTKAISLKEMGETVLIESDPGRTFETDKVVVCIPPQLFSKNVACSPGLVDAFNTLLPGVQTWMAGAIKFTLEYEKPFWRNDGYSGMLYSHAGIITEMYDHTNFEEDKFGFTGFLNGGAAAYPPQVRKELVLRQLSELWGIWALNPTDYTDKVWTDEFILAGDQIIQRPHQNNGHPLLQQAYMHGKLLFAATETSTEYPGYMEGAVIAARSVADKLSERSI